MTLRDAHTGARAILILAAATIQEQPAFLSPHLEALLFESIYVRERHWIKRIWYVELESCLMIHHNNSIYNVM